MDKAAILSMFITFVTSNDVLKFEPAVNQAKVSVPLEPISVPKFCNGLSCPQYRLVKKTEVSNVWLCLFIVNAYRHVDIKVN